MSDNTKQCPFCGETIQITAKKCRHCGEWLDKTKQQETLRNYSNGISFDRFVCEKEVMYFYTMLVISILIYLAIILCTFGIGLIYLAILALIYFVIQAVAVANIKHNSVKITVEQFGDLYEKIAEFSDKLGLHSIPSAYIMQSGGLLNAFVTRFLSNDIVVIYSDIIELAYEKGEDAVNFVIAHELAHIKRNHLTKKKYLMCAEIIPFLGLAYSRACELTCDKIASVIANKKPVEGLMVLAIGKKLYKSVNYNEMMNNYFDEIDFWSWLAEICSTHPHISTRIRELDY
jgi:Zn-dependent protease with chaperone function